MKFQSLIASIMHGTWPATRAALWLFCVVAMSSCVSVNAKKHTYSVTSSAAKVNGAEIRMQVKPEGTENGAFAVSAMVVSAAVATFDGPFRWRIVATGEDGKHKSIILHRIHTRTGKTKRDEWYPTTHLGRRADFKRVKDKTGATRAVYHIPGLLVVKPREDGPLEITVDLTVITTHRRERKMVRFAMDPSQTRQDEFIFIPTEIVTNIGKSTEDWDESGWD